MDEAAKSPLQTRLQALMDHHKKKPSPFAKELGLDDSFIRDILRGKKRTPAADTLARIAEALGTTADYLLGNENGELSGPALHRTGAAISYAGEVQAGEFTRVDDDYFNQDTEPVPGYVMSDNAHSKVRQYAWRARGNSMNAAGILDGMWVVGADASDYVDTYGDIQTEDLVIVERTRNNGQERELTVKEVHFFRDRYELRPVSTDPKFTTITVPHDHDADEAGQQVKIIGVVLTAYANLKRRR